MEGFINVPLDPELERLIHSFEPSYGGGNAVSGGLVLGGDPGQSSDSVLNSFTDDQLSYVPRHLTEVTTMEEMVNRLMPHTNMKLFDLSAPLSKRELASLHVTSLRNNADIDMEFPPIYRDSLEAHQAYLRLDVVFAAHQLITNSLPSEDVVRMSRIVKKAFTYGNNPFEPLTDDLGLLERTRHEILSKAPYQYYLVGHDPRKFAKSYPTAWIIMCNKDLRKANFFVFTSLYNKYLRKMKAAGKTKHMTEVANMGKVLKVLRAGCDAEMMTEHENELELRGRKFDEPRAYKDVLCDAKRGLTDPPVSACVPIPAELRNKNAAGYTSSLFTRHIAIFADLPLVSSCATNGHHSTSTLLSTTRRVVRSWRIP